MTIATMKTAEWNCTKCGATNRKLVDAGQSDTRDRCVTCHARHRVTEDARPVRWQAVADK
jgi:DNA-directed RNA polymerase subunit RPC12/RpoP